MKQVLKSKVFTAGNTALLESNVNEFLEQNAISKADIFNITQSESICESSEGAAWASFTITIFYNQNISL